MVLLLFSSYDNYLLDQRKHHSSSDRNGIGFFAYGFTTTPVTSIRGKSRLYNRQHPQRQRRWLEQNQHQPHHPIVALQLLPDPSFLTTLLLGDAEQLHALLFWVTAFASSHIGMSAIRQTLITNVFGQFVANDVLGIVGNEKLKLPDFWPGDSSGNVLFPDTETAGRQFYRIFYTIISFVTLGSSFSIYLSFVNNNQHHDSINILWNNLVGSSSSSDSDIIINICYVVATLSGAFSLASLLNASPLGLVPSFPEVNESTAIAPGDTLMGITRDDSMKFEPKGLTRITRHPLILPVVPWGLSTSILVGGNNQDYILFGGLALYAIVGCYCQDLRIIREEGSVGTVFTFNDNDGDENNIASGTKTNQKLLQFYNETSFVPFGALFDGRQSWDMILKEFPILPFFLLGIPSSFVIETIFLQFLNR
ncbi:hypothetical protein FRACYDRAFT_208600 [Fragilariopsis cylindrus CCMP1102]|uniref:NnrU domain-containing protein n=1 Tax=Fragilariopsis cylindrus CCMP1102 TaxID=635003 RepID=A0A1E7FFQ4_9STRA|nr:hypothetical protein FRACYDRAFT_208600 [Fragilariopsis cylindrus CCMP1102]|eukprot:OEU17000.1 hypothetical protein FRACYDRAFT_208600 [Fragilariopsis cylindrus CCMP1102]